jgi:hypothetical protein
MSQKVCSERKLQINTNQTKTQKKHGLLMPVLLGGIAFSHRPEIWVSKQAIM